MRSISIKTPSNYNFHCFRKVETERSNKNEKNEANDPQNLNIFFSLNKKNEQC